MKKNKNKKRNKVEFDCNVPVFTVERLEKVWGDKSENFANLRIGLRDIEYKVTQLITSKMFY